MVHPVLFGFAALVTLVPAALLPLRATAAGERGRDGIFWMLTGVATLGPLAFEIALSGAGWQTGFSASLWTIVAATMLVFLATCVLTRSAWRLSVLLLPYLIVLGAIALVWMSARERALDGTVLTAWVEVHIAFSLLTYALLTLAAMTALAVWLKERALRAHRVAAWMDTLPAVADAERLQVRLLVLAEIVLGLGLVSGMASLLDTRGTIFVADHKTVLSVATFVVVGGLLVLHRTSGLRGRRAARFVLLSYLLITLAFPGVKFVTDVLLG